MPLRKIKLVLNEEQAIQIMESLSIYSALLSEDSRNPKLKDFARRQSATKAATIAEVVTKLSEVL